jgi:hypothetical protein
MTKLTDKLNSNYFKARNALNQRKGQTIEVFVENEADVPFWKDIFNRFGQPNIQTKIHPASKDSLARGKQTVLKHAAGAGEFLLLCVDSDYDYLFDGATKQSEQIKQNPFIFQTYAYAIENHQCIAENLQQVVLEATLSDEELFDFVGFMERFSEIIYELWVYACYYERQARQSGSNSLDAINLSKDAINLSNQIDIVNSGENELLDLEKRVAEQLKSLPEIDSVTLNNFKQQLEQLGLKPNNTYLFINGHLLYNRIVKKLLERVCNFLKSEKRQEYKKIAHTPQENSQQCREYHNHTDLRKVECILLTHKNYISCFLIQKIQSDVRRYFQEHWAHRKNEQSET